MLKSMFRGGGYPVSEAMDDIPSIKKLDCDSAWLIVHLDDSNREEVINLLDEISVNLITTYKYQ